MHFNTKVLLRHWLTMIWLTEMFIIKSPEQKRLETPALDHIMKLLDNIKIGIDLEFATNLQLAVFIRKRGKRFADIG